MLHRLVLCDIGMFSSWKLVVFEEVIRTATYDRFLTLEQDLNDCNALNYSNHSNHFSMYYTTKYILYFHVGT